MGDKRILTTTDGFDDMVDGATDLLWLQLGGVADPSASCTVYMFQDFTYSLQNDDNKDKICKITFTVQDLLNEVLTRRNHTKFYFKAKIYQRIARNRDLFYFNKIKLQT